MFLELLKEKDSVESLRDSGARSFLEKHIEDSERLGVLDLGILLGFSGLLPEPDKWGTIIEQR